MGINYIPIFKDHFLSFLYFFIKKTINYNEVQCPQMLLSIPYIYNLNYYFSNGISLSFIFIPTLY